MKDSRPTIWSSEQGDLGKKRAKPAAKTSLQPQGQTAYLHRESKGRGGKTVTLVKNLALSGADMKALAKKFKSACGSGGTVKGSVVEIQGKHREKIANVWRKLGFNVKLSGG